MQRYGARKRKRVHNVQTLVQHRRRGLHVAEFQVQFTLAERSVGKDPVARSLDYARQLELIAVDVDPHRNLRRICIAQFREVPHAEREQQHEQEYRRKIFFVIEFHNYKVSNFFRESPADATKKAAIAGGSILTSQGSCKRKHCLRADRNY